MLSTSFRKAALIASRIAPREQLRRVVVGPAILPLLGAVVLVILFEQPSELLRRGCGWLPCPSISAVPLIAPLQAALRALVEQGLHSGGLVIRHLGQQERRAVVQGGHCLLHRRLLQPGLGEQANQAWVVGGADVAKAMGERGDGVVVHVGEAARALLVGVVAVPVALGEATLAYRPAIGVDPSADRAIGWPGEVPRRGCVPVTLGGALQHPQLAPSMPIASSVWTAARVCAPLAWLRTIIVMVVLLSFVSWSICRSFRAVI